MKHFFPPNIIVTSFAFSVTNCEPQPIHVIRIVYFISIHKSLGIPLSCTIFARVSMSTLRLYGSHLEISIVAVAKICSWVS